MTGMLASVNSLEEAKLVYHAGVDIIDLKEPSRGALGALDLTKVRQICTWFAGRTPVSATVGDLPMNPDLIAHAVSKLSKTGVDYIKIGFFPGGDWQAVIESLSILAGQNQSLIAVLFADTHPDMIWVDSLYRAHFKGVMLDTITKGNGSLATIMCPGHIEHFVQETKKRGMLCGLAGSLRYEDIAAMAHYHPDYLGFRGALCTSQNRTASLDFNQISRIKNALLSAPSF